MAARVPKITIENEAIRIANRASELLLGQSASALQRLVAGC